MVTSPDKYGTKKPQSPGSWPASTAKTLTPPTSVYKKAASLRTEGMATLSGALMPTCSR